MQKSKMVSSVLEKTTPERPARTSVLEGQRRYKGYESLRAHFSAMGERLEKKVRTLLDVKLSDSKAIIFENPYKLIQGIQFTGDHMALFAIENCNRKAILDPQSLNILNDGLP